MFCERMEKLLIVKMNPIENLNLMLPSIPPLPYVYIFLPRLWRGNTDVIFGHLQYTT